MSAESQPNEFLINVDSLINEDPTTSITPMKVGTSAISVSPILNQDHSETDESVSRVALMRLAQHSHFGNSNQTIRCEVHDRVLRLTGSLPSYFLKQLAQEALRDLQGIDQIENQIVVVSLDELNQKDLSDFESPSESNDSPPAKPR